MGWNSGSSLMDDIISDMMQYPALTDQVRKLVYNILIENFENRDCDVLEECRHRDPMYDIALQEYHPDWEFYEEGEEL